VTGGLEKPPSVVSGDSGEERAVGDDALENDHGRSELGQKLGRAGGCAGQAERWVRLGGGWRSLHDGCSRETG
jgi:hypothetical protein